MKSGIGFLLLLLSAVFVVAQDVPQPNAANTRRKGTITGRVVADDGQPLPNVRVTVYSTGNEDGSRSSVQTDAEGNFSTDGLPPAAYGINAYNSAYVSAENNNSANPKYYRLGETALLTLTRGGVITGRLTDAMGEPLIEMGVAALRVRNLDGTKIRAEQRYSSTRLTDDRGRYRIYGLEPGVYIVQANATAYYYRGGDAHLGEKPLYYPSSPRESAQEITVNAGEEVRGIDLRYRGEPGFRVSGNVLGGASSAGSRYFGGISLSLKTYPGGQVVNSTSVAENAPERKFTFFGLADGQYTLEAEGRFGNRDELDYHRGTPRRITIKGGDVANIQLQLVPLSSIEGVVTLDPLAEKERPAKAKPARQAWPEETMVILRPETERAEDDNQNLRERARKAPNEKGEIKYNGLLAGRYRLTAQLPSDDWYVKAVQLPAPKAETPPAKAAAPIDVGKQGLQLKAGDRLKGLTVTLAEGAAGLSGRIVAEKSSPPAARVHLIPAEKDAGEAVLRYYEVLAQADGTFAFAHLAPGQYWLLAQPAPRADAKPVAWDTEARNKLRQAAASNNVIELKTCQRVNDYALRFGK